MAFVTFASRNIDDTEWYENDGTWDSSASLPVALDDTVADVLATVHNPEFVEVSGTHGLATFPISTDPSTPLGDYTLTVDGTSWLAAGRHAADFRALTQGSAEEKDARALDICDSK